MGKNKKQFYKLQTFSVKNLFFREHFLSSSSSVETFAHAETLNKLFLHSKLSSLSFLNCRSRVQKCRIRKFIFDKQFFKLATFHFRACTKFQSQIRIRLKNNHSQKNNHGWKLLEFSNSPQSQSFCRGGKKTN